jgi:vancomycin permeability regulator SanA
MKTAIAVLSSGLKLDKIKGWISTPFYEQDEKYGAPGGDLRILATFYLYLENLNWYIIVSGGVGSEKKFEKKSRPLLSKVMKKELIDLGVPMNLIIEENRSNTTFQQLHEISNLISQLSYEKILIISNQYHLPRIKSFIKNYSVLKGLSNKVELVEAENIVIKNNPALREVINQAYQGQRIKNIIQNELKGIKDIESGNYKI